MTTSLNLRFLQCSSLSTIFLFCRKKHQDYTRTLTFREFSFYPLSVGIIIISLIQVLLFGINKDVEYESTKSESGPIAELFIYDPQRRQEIWRFITYMFVHVDAAHLVKNLLVQIILGTILEMVHGWSRVLIVYFAGVMAGSLGSSIADPALKLAGASGGTYSLLGAHIASIIMNWTEISFRSAQVVVFPIGAALSIIECFMVQIEEHNSCVAHCTGELAGLLVGICVLRNLSGSEQKRFIWYISMVTFVLLIGISIIWNLAWPSSFEDN